MSKPTAPTLYVRNVALTPGALDLGNTALYVALSISTVQKLVREAHFPPPRKLSAGRVGFLVRELDEWLESRPVSQLLPPPSTHHSNRKGIVSHLA